MMIMENAEDIDFNKICRTCISQSDVNAISGMKINGIGANELLDYTVQIDIRNSEKLPQQLCMNCVKVLYQFFQFKLRTHENENIFKTLLEKSGNSKLNVPIKLEDSYPIQELITITINSDGDDEEERTSENGDEVETYEKENMFEFKMLLENAEKSKQNESVKFESEDFYSIQEITSEIIITKSSDSDDEEEGTSKNGNEEEKDDEESTNSNEAIINSPFKTVDKSVEQNRSELDESSARKTYNIASIEDSTFMQDDVVIGERKSNIDNNKDVDDEEIPEHLTRERHERNNFSVKSISNSCICGTCGRGFKNPRALKRHQNNQHRPKKFLCSVCERAFPFRSDLKSHSRIHTGERPYTCNICNKTFSYASGLRKHMRVHSGEKPHTCEFCDKSFTYRTSLVYHLILHRGEKSFMCPHCGEKFTKIDLPVHIRTHTGEAPYKCEVCGKGYRDLSDKRRHIFRHHNKVENNSNNSQEIQEITSEITITKNSDSDDEKEGTSKNGDEEKDDEESTNSNEAIINSPFKTVDNSIEENQSELDESSAWQTSLSNPCICRTCGRGFKDPRSLRKHQNRLHRPKKFLCGFCGRGFMDRSDLKYHLRTHTGEKPFMCPYCDRKFSRSGSLNVHIRTHTGETPYKCEVCGKGFKDYANRARHIFRHHNKVENNSNNSHEIQEITSEITITKNSDSDEEGRTSKNGDEEEKDDEESTNSSEAIINSPFKTVDKSIEENQSELDESTARKTYNIASIEDSTFMQDDVIGERKSNIDNNKDVDDEEIPEHLTRERHERNNSCIKSILNSTNTGGICGTCGGVFKHLRRHQNNQHRPKKFLCNFCERGFTSRSDLKYHLRTHTGERPFMCPHCDKKFTKSGNLNVHIRTHTGEAPYKCEVCGKGFRDSTNKARHIFRHHNKVENNSNKIPGEDTCRDHNKVKLEII